MFGDDPLFLGGQLAAPAEDLGDPPLRRPPFGIGDLRHHLFSRNGPQAARHAHVGGIPHFVRLHISAAPIAIIGAHHAAHAPLHDGIDGGLIAPLSARAPGKDGIAVQGAVQR